MALIKFILYALLIYYGLKMLFRLLFPVVVRKAVKNFEQKIKDQQQRASRQYHEQPPDGRIKVEYTPPQKKDAAIDDDYIEYEEVK